TPDGFCGGSSSTTPPNTQAGSTWSRSRSASCGASAWIAGSTIPSAYAAKSPPGSGREMPPGHASNGCSQQTRPAPKWAAPIPLLPKSHNHCAEPLVPSPMPLRGHLQWIFCRTFAEHEMFSHLLGRTRDAWLDKMVVSEDFSVFERRFVFVDYVGISHEGVTFQLNPRQDAQTVNVHVKAWGKGEVEVI